jgi:hypothetical protein
MIGRQDLKRSSPRRSRNLPCAMAAIGAKSLHPSTPAASPAANTEAATAIPTCEGALDYRDRRATAINVRPRHGKRASIHRQNHTDLSNSLRVILLMCLLFNTRP